MRVVGGANWWARAGDKYAEWASCLLCVTSYDLALLHGVSWWQGQPFWPWAFPLAQDPRLSRFALDEEVAPLPSNANLVFCYTGNYRSIGLGTVEHNYAQ